MKKSKDIKISYLLGIIIIVIVTLVTIPLFYNQFNSSMLLLKDKTIDDFKDEEKLTEVFITSQLEAKRVQLREAANNFELRKLLESKGSSALTNVLKKVVTSPIDADFIFLSYDGSEQITDVSLNILNTKQIINDYLENHSIERDFELYTTKTSNLIAFLKEDIISRKTGRILATMHTGYILNNRASFFNNLSLKVLKTNFYFIINDNVYSSSGVMSVDDAKAITSAKVGSLIQSNKKLFYITKVKLDDIYSIKVAFETSSNYVKNLKSSYIYNFLITVLTSILLCIIAIYIANRLISPPLEHIVNTISLLMIRNLKSTPRRSFIREFNLIEDNFISVFDKFQQKKSQLASFVSSSPISILILDYKGKIIQTNDASINLFEISDKNGNILKDSALKNCDDFKEMLSTIKDRKKIFEDEFNFKSGEKWKNTLWTIHQDNKENYIFIQCVDNTEKLETQSIIEAQRSKSVHNQKLAAIGEIASSVAHEINNTMGIVSLSLTMLENELEQLEINSEKKKENIRKSISNIENSVERTSQIISNLLDFSREGSKDRLESKNLDLVLNKTLLFIEEKLKKNKITLNTQGLDKDINIYIKETQFSQILVNLFNNSIDSLIGQERREINLSTRVEDTTCYLHFKDTGRGIPKELEEKIFSPFFTTKSVGSGTGLGLSISKNLLLEMSGDIKLEREDSGAHFIVSIPIKN